MKRDERISEVPTRRKTRVFRGSGDPLRDRLGCSEVQEILCGTVYVFPKIDGTNAQVWADIDGNMHYGSRRRELTLDNDNAGFMAWASGNENITSFCQVHRETHLFGEWLVPHSLKTYRENAWRRFYVFDVVTFNGDDARHMDYESYKPALDARDIEYIVPQRILINPSVEDCMRETDANEWLVTEGKGEGVVLKNYDFVNKYGRQVWAKIVTSDFKQKHHKEMGAPITKCTSLVEPEVVEDLLTADIIDKVYANICCSEGGWSSKMIPRLLETVWHDFVIECSYEMVKKWKLPTINYKTLKAFTIQKIKALKPELF